jgi:hypothetical protein|tara:strand:+ start:863 stop:1075 length:213 start_codon:yes stop_codon:yes gene_type:complete
MIKWNNIEMFFQSQKQYLWKSKLKTGTIFILIGYLIFILKELIIGLISLIFIIIGSYFLISAFLIWKERN